LDFHIKGKKKIKTNIFNERRSKMEDKIKEYYSKFKEIYTKENYPKWFAFCNDHNKQYGDEGYKKGKSGHELKHYAILQTPLPEMKNKKTEIVMVGKNNSWFDKDDMKNSLKIVKQLKNGIPEDDYYLKKGSNFANRLNSQIEQIGFKNKKAEDLLKNHRVGMNRIWLQTGTSDENIKEMNEYDQKASLEKKFSSSLIQRCHKWTEEIIDIIDPELVLIFGSGTYGADKLFNEQEGKLEREKASFVVKHCYHPSSSVPFDTQIDIILDGLDEAELLND